MNLTLFTDYSLRTLMYAASLPSEELANIDEIAKVYGISRNHLTKAVHRLGQLGYIQTIRGRNGGFRLAKPATEIRIGDVVRQMEENLHVVECFQAEAGICILNPTCRLKRVLQKAMEAFLSVLDEYTLADVVGDPVLLRVLFAKNRTS
ncbi:HTH-type transcriptional regulator NsrR [Alicyclobacillus hesperidum]|uniref:HTH-type transcriptional regulator NsrR n=1 Tax=Alicyclobacillus hesperidum TaxID=89784 RepID=A0A1H2QCW3_9BACL|nr:Rrf2 family transcriptional regulator [Alicyclobacillus hesperidum]GLV12707.1 HTH-type transcriptional regulator NsrR [Alicyclobacillus hesperidum]SDW04648.1 transcriptional regulator, BadM/Rrf2 family [Alicyclobacillus hesperidum]